MSNELDDEPPLLSPAQVAHRLGVKVSWVYAQASQGKLPCVRLGKYLRFVPGEIDAWLAQHRRGTTASSTVQSNGIPTRAGRTNDKWRQRRGV